MFRHMRPHLALLTAVITTTLVPGLPVQAQEANDAALSDYASESPPPLFATSDAAIDAFKKVVEGDKPDDLAVLLGLDAAKAKASEGVMDSYSEIKSRLKQKLVIEDVDGRKVLELGDDLWPFPFPVSPGDDGKWAFDTYAGLEEIANRLVGENELQTISTMRQYVDAQEEYAAEDRDDDGVLEYAQKLISRAGQRDGLYWPVGEGEVDDSPAGEALAEADVLSKAKAGEGYNGYHYRILTSQSDNIAGGQFDYVINGNMIAGFGLAAWPVKYGVSGVHTFLVNRDGIVYEADLGEQTDKVASGIRRFNPNDDWQVVND
ncbi:DUF2950 family protein [Ensifer adhaerens]|uniref:DUF2950 family protein n=1 Tax=Ensifer adhaerens TaxID=106592 RepID=UPI003D094159